MSGVLLSTVSAERLTPSRAPPHRSAGTSRNLFGPVDHDELRRELASKLREISERDQLRWSFDFSEGQPRDGDLKWERSPAEDCPEFYRETTAGSKRHLMDSPTIVAPKYGGRSVKVLNQKNQPNKCNRRQLSRKAVARVQRKRLTDTRITDFYGKQKQSSEEKKRTSPASQSGGGKRPEVMTSQRLTRVITS